MIHKYKYYIPAYDELSEDATSFESEFVAKDELHIKWIAEKAAESFHDHGGFESSWPIDFVLLDMDNNEIGRFNVEREFEPTFIAVRT